MSGNLAFMNNLKMYKNLCNNMLITVSFKCMKNRQPTQTPDKEKRLNKLQSIHMLEYYLAIKYRIFEDMRKCSKCYREKCIRQNYIYGIRSVIYGFSF